QASTDTLNVNDQANPWFYPFTIAASTISRTAAGLITYGTMEGVTINGGTGQNTYNVQSTAAATPVTINAGSGDDTVNVTMSAWNPVFNLAQTTLLGNLTVNGQAG